MFKGLRWRLLASYVIVMAAILSVFGAGVYIFVGRSLYRQLDKKLQTLAQAATPSLKEIRVSGSEYLNEVEEAPWRDIFNRDQQSLEWFDAQGKLLANRGDLVLGLAPKSGSWTIKGTADAPQIRTFTVPVQLTEELEPGQTFLGGYVRASQSTESLEIFQKQLLFGLGIGGVATLGLVGIGGFWLTQKSIEPIEQSFHQLKQFTADASHELRGPLTAIKASVDVMCNHPERIHPKDAKKISAIANATSQMTNLTEDLLYLARTDGTRAVSDDKWHSVALNPMLQGLVDLLEPFAQDKNIALKFESSTKAYVMGDDAQLSRLFSNLLENALQYTPEGGRVTIRLMKNSISALISVEDTGIGIAADQIPFVFDRFWRADKARSRRQGGTGLGLAIAQAIAQRHRGKITVTSQVNVGTSFQVRLPLKGIVMNQKAGGRSASSPPSKSVSESVS
ncbi:MAG: sensor histidine kinase [Cyanophyceae cyanobacterium]